MMKFSPKQLLINNKVSTKMVWLGQFCKVCNHKVYFETMHKIGKDFYCMDCCPTKESTFDVAFPNPITPHDIIVKQEREKARRTLYELLEEIDGLPDGEVSPSVYNVLLKYSPDVNK